MKNMFRKALTVLGSAVMIGATIGAASAAAYPSPFTSNTAIVVGANAAPSDSIAASSIAADLDAAAVGTSMSGETTTVTGGDSYKFEKTSTKYHLGDTITGVVSSPLDEDQMPKLLAKGTYTDSNNDEFDYTQAITMGASQLKMFDDNDYKADSPTVGYKLTSGNTVLTYTLSFTKEPTVANMETTDLVFMGKKYYVLDASWTGGVNTMTLLDSADSTIVAEGETVTLTAGTKTYSVGVEFVDSTSAKLKINGETTNKLSAGQTFKLSDGSYVGVKEVLYSAKDTGISKVEFSIGNGKLVLTSGSEVELNEDTIDGLTATLSNSSAATLSSIALTWKASDDLFITQDRQAKMPGFNAVQLAYGGLHYPAEENIMVEFASKTELVLGKFPMKTTSSDVPLLYINTANFVNTGKDSENLLRTDGNRDGNITFDGDTDYAFVASFNDGRDAESYLMRATNFKTVDTINRTTIQYMKDNSWTDAKSDAKDGDSVSVGNVELTLGAVDKLGKNVIVQNTTNVDFNTLYSKEGMKVNLPYDSLTSTSTGVINLSASPTTYNLTFAEEDKDGNIGSGKWINVTLGLNSQSPKEITVSSYTAGPGSVLAGAQEVDNSEVFRDFTYSALATEIMNDQGPNQNTLKLVYHGDEVSADVYVTSTDAVVSGGSGSAGVMTVLDSAVATVAGKNLIVVGGSAINSVAAELLGGAYSEAQFTAKTGVGAGQFLIQSFDRAGKTALLVAGYNAADTTKAATYLVNNAVDTAMSKKYKGTSATEASLVVA